MWVPRSDSHESDSCYVISCARLSCEITEAVEHKLANFKKYSEKPVTVLIGHSGTKIPHFTITGSTKETIDNQIESELLGAMNGPLEAENPKSDSTMPIQNQSAFVPILTLVVGVALTVAVILFLLRIFGQQVSRGKNYDPMNFNPQEEQFILDSSGRCLRDESIF